MDIKRNSKTVASKKNKNCQRRDGISSVCLSGKKEIKNKLKMVKLMPDLSNREEVAVREAQWTNIMKEKIRVRIATP